MKIKYLKNFLFLFALWFALTLWSILQYDDSFFIRTSTHPFSAFYESPEGKVTKGRKITGEVVASENNLGSLSIYFNVGKRIAYPLEDILIFRIKEKNSNNWYYENIYRSGMMYDKPFFPFGFEPIADSKGKIYQFELESLRGNETNAHTVRRAFPTLETRYLVDRNLITSDIPTFAGFVLNKIISKTTTLELMFFSFIVSLPLLIYLLWIFFLHKTFKPKLIKTLNSNKILYPLFIKFLKVQDTLEELYFQILGICLFSAVVIDIFFIHVRADLIYLVVMIMWIKSYINNRLADGISIVLAIGMLTASALLDILSFNNSAMKASAWSLVFFMSSIVFLLKKRKFTDKKAVIKKQRIK